MTRETKILCAVILIMTIIITAFVVSLFNGPGKVDDSQFKEIIKAKDETIRAVEDHRATLEKQWQDHVKTDSSIVKAIENNKPKYIINDKKYNDIPATIHDYTKEQLRSAASDY